MKGKVISFFTKVDGELIQVCGQESDSSIMEVLGFSLAAADCVDNKGVNDPDMATIQDHMLAIDHMTEKDDIESYALSVNGISIDKRGSLDTVKTKAIKALKDGDDSSTGN